MKKILLTTTESLHGWEIETYLKPVFANVVVGAGFLSDLSAGLTDFFGGRSETYEKKLQTVNDNALNILKSKALELGGNCILGLKVDMDQISGKNVQMFMVTAYGTAVVAKAQSAPKKVDTTEVDKSTINEKATLIKLLGDIRDPKYQWRSKDLQTIIDSKSGEFKEYVFSKMRSHLLTSALDVDAKNRTTRLFTEYFINIDPEEAIDVLYNGLLAETNKTLLHPIANILSEFDLVDYGYCSKLLDNELLEKKKLALKILNADKPFYVASDVATINDLSAKIEGAFPQRVVISTKKGLLSSNEKEMWTCECGKTNSFDTNFCFNCSKDKFGFLGSELQPADTVEALRCKATALTEFFKL